VTADGSAKVIAGFTAFSATTRRRAPLYSSISASTSVRTCIHSTVSAVATTRAVRGCNSAGSPK